MADMMSLQKGNKQSRKVPGIDFTPMVDLGFLLITFFMFTTTMAKTKTMEINMPEERHDESPTAFIEESTVTLIPTSGHMVAYYFGSLNENEKPLVTTQSGIRDLLLTKKKSVAQLPASFTAEAHKLHVLIKPYDLSKYGDVVSLLDEMNIVGVPYYALVDITEEEKILIGRQ
jgi:biopolymer transport protein ExbD